MKALTAEWVRKAEADFHSCRRETRARRHPNYDSACFHAQPCAEKYLKARLQEAGLGFPKTHDLNELLKRVVAVEPSWQTLQPALDVLANYAVVFRYPGFWASRSDALKALKACHQVRRTARRSLGLKP